MAWILMSVGVVAIASAQDYSWPYGGEAPGWALFGLGMLCIVPIIWFIIAILIAIWVYKDAEKRGSSGILWLIIVLIAGIVGLIIWLVVRPPIGGNKPAAASSGRKCPNCGRDIPMDARACPYCGKNFEEK